MLIYGLDMNVDVEEVLKACRITRFIDKGDEIYATCPNHAEKNPSWSINKNTGVHHCFACGYSGDVVSLLTDFCPEVDDEIKALRWLHEHFPVMVMERKPLDIEQYLQRGREKDVVLDESILDAYDFRHPYLYERGLQEPVLRAFRIGWTAEDVFTDSSGKEIRVRRAITIPWRDRQGRLRMIQYRQLEGTKYINRGEQRRKLLFGIDKVVKRRVQRVALCEGFGDALSLWQAGKPAVAIGSAYITHDQVRELQLSGVRHVDLCLDNDDTGKKGLEHAVEMLGKCFRLSAMVYPRDEVKDPGSLTMDELRNLTFAFV